MNPVMLNPSPHKGYHCLRVQTHHHHSRYPKSRLFGYLPDLPYVISCMNAGTQKVGFLGTSQIYHRTSLPKSSDPSPPQQLPKKSTFWVPPRFTIRDLLHEHRYPKSRLFGYVPDLPSDVIACMNPVMLNPSPHKGYHCLRVQTHHHHSRYPKSRLFGYLPDLPYVISCMNPVVMMMRSSPTSPRLYPAVQAHSVAEDPSQAKLQRWVSR